MTSSEMAAAVRLGFLEYRAAYPWRIVVTTEWPRSVLQCLFFTVLGGVVGGADGARFALVGSIPMIMLLHTIIGISDVPGTEKWDGTFYRLQLSGVSPAGMFALRAIPWVAQAMVSAVLCLAVVGPVTGNGRLALALVPALPLFTLMAVTSAAAGLAVASPAIGHRVDLVVTNAMVYLLIATGGLLIPAGRSAVVDAIGWVLPLRHGVLAVRSWLVDGPWVRETALEALVGLGWALLAVLLYRWQSVRARTTGSDEFT